MKKNMFVIPLLTLLIFYFGPAFSVYADSDTESGVIGIVFSVKGTLIHKNRDIEEIIEPGMKIYSESLIDLADVTRRGKIQIITSGGPVIFSRFPVTFSNETYAALTIKQQNNYISNIGGTVISGRASNMSDDTVIDMDYKGDCSGADTLFEWHTDPGVLTETELEKGFSLYISKEKSSLENSSLNPLYFKLLENISIKESSFEIMKDNTFTTVFENGKFNRSGDDLVFRFDCFDYSIDTPYIAEVEFTFPDGNRAYWEFGFTIAGEKKVGEVEEEAVRTVTGEENDFEKGLMRAKIYMKYNMKISAVSILKDLGFDIADML